MSFLIALLILVGLIVGIVGILAFFVMGIYNKLVTIRNRVKNAWAQIDVQLKRRYDLIPNLVETAKGYLKHERETLEAVIKARQIAIDASTVKDQIDAENALSSSLRSMMMLTENYPDLKGNQNMMALQEELTSTENKIGFSRQHYNDQVMIFNTTREQFPNSLIANTFNFQAEPFFELTDEEQREAPNVKF
jgi:LemA protein